MAIQGIYRIYNKLNNKSYIGRSIDIERRWKEHIGTKGSVLLHQDIKNFGIENFTFEILELCHDKEEMILKEEYWIQFYDSFKNGYNQNEGGSNIQAIEKTSKKIYCYNLDGYFLKEYKSLSEAERELNIPNANISKAARGLRDRAGKYQWSYEKKDNIGPYKRKTFTGTRTSGSGVKKVKQYDKEGNLLNIFSSITIAAQETGANGTCIGEICKTKGKGKRKTSGGFIWRFEEDDI